MQTRKMDHLTRSRHFFRRSARGTSNVTTAQPSKKQIPAAELNCKGATFL